MCYKVNVQAAHFVFIWVSPWLTCLRYCCFYRVWEYWPSCWDIFIHDVLKAEERYNCTPWIFGVLLPLSIAARCPVGDWSPCQDTGLLLPLKEKHSKFSFADIAQWVCLTCPMLCLWGHHVLRLQGVQMEMSQVLAPILSSALLVNGIAICCHLDSGS